ncbi:MAG TPA: phage Gp37/Gp68 family protein [Woeseiaceae bacterium]|nr:phage Gp37/Gp68 family protein [Woeseiaceae bacterium]
MAARSAIEWTDATWNPVSGCTKISPGCDNCYAERIAERFRGVPNHPFEHGFDLTLRHHKLREPLSWQRPRRIFVNSMSDLFHKKIPLAFVSEVFDTMEQAHWHVFQILTKRSSLLRRFINDRYRDGRAPPHIWLGVSVEDRRALVRLRHLADSKATIRFASFEPLLEDLGTLDLAGIHWAIAGGESGPKARLVDPDWIRSIRDQCRAADVAFFFKQWGGLTSKSRGNSLDGRRWLQYPELAAG